MKSECLLAGIVALGSTTACAGPERPTVREEGAARPANCRDAVAAAFPASGDRTLLDYRDVVRRCSSLEELQALGAYDGPNLRLDCRPPDIVELEASLRQPGTDAADVPKAPPDLPGTPICRQFIGECIDVEELRRDTAAVARNPTLANLGVYVRTKALLE
ncbi:MAG: hypothetical protein ACRDY7_08995, partial [Acidimicrobiia bacterium]